jgi:hypothetical protein
MNTWKIICLTLVLASSSVYGSDADKYKKILANAATSDLTYATAFTTKLLSATVKDKELDLLLQSLQPTGKGRDIGRSRPTASVVTAIILKDKSAQKIAEIVVTDRLAYLNLDGTWIAFPIEETKIQRRISQIFQLKESKPAGSPF